MTTSQTKLNKLDCVLSGIVFFEYKKVKKRKLLWTRRKSKSALFEKKALEIKKRAKLINSML